MSAQSPSAAARPPALPGHSAPAHLSRWKRHLAHCPRCRTLIDRNHFFHLGMDVTCSGCQARLTEKPLPRWWWSLLFFNPGGVSLGLAWCGVLSWTIALAVVVASVLLGWVLFPFVSRLQIVVPRQVPRPSSEPGPQTPAVPVLAPRPAERPPRVILCPQSHDSPSQSGSSSGSLCFCSFSPLPSAACSFGWMRKGGISSPNFQPLPLPFRACR